MHATTFKESKDLDGPEAGRKVKKEKEKGSERRFVVIAGSKHQKEKKEIKARITTPAETRKIAKKAKKKKRKN